MTTVSIIIPYYKKKKFISQTLDSIRKQTFKDVEVIIIYDDEDMSELDFLTNVKEKFSNLIIKILVNNKNLGAGIARNKGIEKAKGEYIAFLDADDLWLENKISKQLNFMKENHYDFSHTNYSIIDENEKIKKIIKSQNFNKIENLLPSCDIGLSTVIMKKKLFNSNIKFSNMKTKEDFYLWLTLLQNGHNLYHLNENFTFWRKTKNSLSSSIYQKLLDGFHLYYKRLGFSFAKSIILLMILSFNSLKKK